MSEPIQILFGTATVDITPPVGVRLMGFEPRASDRIGHPLRAEALACEAGSGGWLLVSADLCAFSSRLADRVRAEIARRTGLSTDAVVLVATHTHSGPHVTDAHWCEQSGLESGYFRRLEDRLTDVAEQAWRTRLPGSLVYGRTEAAGLGSNRRVQREDGTWANQWRDPEGKNTGYCDPTVDLLGVRRTDDSLEALLVNFGCHPVGFGFRNRAISGDYVSYLKDALETNGKVKTTLFTVSGHANVDPRDGLQSDPAVVRRMGESLAARVAEAIPSLQPVRGSGASAVYEPWVFRTTWNIEGRVAIYFPHAERGVEVRSGLSVLTVGDVALLGLPGETVSEYRAKFEQRSPFPHTILISLANDFVGYLPTDAILKQGAYEAELCPLSPLEDELTARVNAAFQRCR